MTMCVFVYRLKCTATCTFNTFWYFLSTHQSTVIKFPICFFFISYMLQLSYVDVCIDRKKIKCIHNITITSMYPLYIVRY